MRKHPRTKYLLPVVLTIMLCVCGLQAARAGTIDIPDKNLLMWVNMWLGGDRDIGEEITEEAVISCTNTYFYMGNGVRNATGLNEVLRISMVTSICLGYDQEYKDLSFLKDLPLLENVALPCPSTKIKDFSAISTLKNLKELTVSDGGLTDIGSLARGLAGADKLTRLNLSGNNITTIKQLSTLKSLRELVLDGNKRFTNASELMPWLTSVSLIGCGISDISPIAKLSDLIEIGLSIDNIKNPGWLASLDKLTSVRLSSTALNSLDFLPSRAITSLSANGCGITDISMLLPFTNLEALELDDNYITDIKPLAKLTKLKYLSVQNNYLTSLAPIKGRKFDRLLCAYNYITIPSFESYALQTADEDSWNTPQRRVFAVDSKVKNISTVTLTTGKKYTCTVLNRLTYDNKTYSFSPDTDISAKIRATDIAIKTDKPDVVSVTKADGIITITGLKSGTATVTITARGIDSFNTRYVIKVEVEPL